MTPRQPLTPDQDVRHDWKRINAIDEDLSAAGIAGASLRDTVAGQRPWLGISNAIHPFKIYQLPPTIRKARSQDGPDDWRKFRVRVGRVVTDSADGGIVSDGTDNAANPDVVDYPDVPDILVPENTVEYWFWIELDGESGAALAVRSDDDPTTVGPNNPNPWTEFPGMDGLHLPIGFVDTLTRSADKVAIVRQLIRTDLVFPGTVVCT